ncbi:MAG: NusG domain II-containing protein [Coriobacteriaceae bacterium]|jgi:hypothetical protein|nr:NusG domain II-containing protein [Coriobacteriaceae bacterium]
MSSFETKRIWASILVVAIPLVLALGAQALIGMQANAAPGAMALVTDGEGRVWELPLDTDATLTVTTSLGSNTVEVAQGKVMVAHADCPGGDCTFHTPISNVGEAIICLPHHLTVTIRAAGQAGEADGQAGDTAAPEAPASPAGGLDVVAD